MSTDLSLRPPRLSIATLVLVVLAPACTPDGDTETLVASAAAPAEAQAQGLASRGMAVRAERTATVRLDELATAASPTPTGVRVVPAPEPARGPSPGAPDTGAATSATPAAPAPLAIPSPSPSASFLASEANWWNPPDTNGAAGLNHVVVAINGTVRVQSKTGAILSTVSLDDFFRPVRSQGGTFDPVIQFDSLGGRFVLMCSGGPGDTATAAFLVAVTQTADPTGAWHLYSFDGDPEDVTWIDFPKMGMNNKWVVVMGTMYGGVGLTSTILACDRAALLDGTGQCTRFTNRPWRTMPALTFDPAVETMYLARHGDFPGGVGNNIKLDTITGPVGAEIHTLDVATATMPESWAIGPGVGQFMPQLGSSTKIGSDPENIVSFVYRNGSLWGVNTAALPPSAPTRTATQWWQITPSGAVQQFGRVEDPTGAVFYNFPSLAVNKNNDVLVGFSRYTAEQYIAAGYAYRNGSDPPSAMRLDAVLKPGETVYGNSRWGDYSATAVDPANDLDMWTIQEYAAAPIAPGIANWGTWWGKITPPGPTSVVTVGPTADGYVQDGTSASTNFGTATTLQVKSTATTGTNRWTYLRFPLTSVTGAVSTARLRLRGSRPTTANGVTDSAYAVASNSWTETGLTWNNKPATGAAQGFGVAVHTNAHYYEWDVTSFVKAQKAAGQSAVSLAVRMDANVSIGPDTFSSREAASNRPELVVVFGSASDLPPMCSPPQASPNPVPGNTTMLSIACSDDGGETALTYTWSALGPGTVTFSSNGSNAAKNTTATFSQAGAYTLTATVRDGSNQTVNSSVSVTVNQTFSAVTVAPASATVAVGTALQFTATARDQFGAVLATQPPFTWTVDGGGTINATGLFSAETPGGPFTITASSGGHSGTALVIITTGSTTPLAPVADAHVRDGTSANTNFGTTTTLEQKFSTVAGNHRRAFLRFDLTAIGANVSAAKLRLHGSSATSAKLVGVYAVSDVTWGETTITWNNAPMIGAKQGASKSVGTTAAYVEWDLGSYVQAQKTAGASAITLEVKQDVANNEGATTFSSRQAASNRPELVVTWTGGGGGDEPPFVVTPAAASPNPVSGTSTALSVLGGDDQGESALTYTWSATGPASVTFSANGTNGAKNTTATFMHAGTYDVLATIRDGSSQTATSTLVVTVNQTLTTITVAPASASVPTGGTQLFTATGRDQFGRTFGSAPTFTWSVSGGGSIASNGLFTAGTTPGGPFTVTAASDGKTGTAQVTVTGGGPITLTPSADAHVRDGTSAGTNFGAASTLEQKFSTVTGNHRRTFLRFAIGSLGAVSSAKLRLHGSSVTSAKLVGVYAVASVTWGETTITWNNAPAAGAKQGTSKSVGTTAAYVEWDVSSYVQAQKAAGAAEVAFEVKQDTANNEGPTTFSAKEAASNRPQLVITP